MLKFDPEQLKQLRLSKKITATALAKQMEVSPAQVHRLENGNRRLTVDALFSYCRGLGVAPESLLVPNSWVPILGAIHSDFDVLPIAKEKQERTLAPPMSNDMGNLAALCWKPSKRFALMENHLAFFHQHNEGIPNSAWSQRCLITREDGSQCLGWPIKQGNKVHIDTSDGQVEFETKIGWASPIVSVMPPWAIEQLRPPSD